MCALPQDSDCAELRRREEEKERRREGEKERRREGEKERRSEEVKERRSEEVKKRRKTGSVREAIGPRGKVTGDGAKEVARTAGGEAAGARVIGG